MAKVIGVLASGRGSNLQAILDAIAAGRIPGKIGVVVSDKPQAFALERARSCGIPAVVVERKQYVTKEQFERALVKELHAHGVELVVLAGFMRILGGDFIQSFANRILNIHPTLLPSFPGLHPHEQAIAYGVKVSGCTVHFVDEGMDSGPVVLQEVVPVQDSDTPDTLAERVLAAEHSTYPRAIALFCQGRLHIQGRRVIVLPEEKQEEII